MFDRTWTYRDVLQQLDEVLHAAVTPVAIHLLLHVPRQCAAAAGLVHGLHESNNTDAKLEVETNQTPILTRYPSCR